MNDSGGGGGGAYNSNSSPETNTNETIDSARNTEINTYLFDLLRDKINQKDTELINKRKDEIQRILSSEFPDVFDLSVGGSYSKYTYVNGLSDIDILVDLGDFTSSPIAEKENSKKLLEHFAERIKQRYPQTDISIGKMAVTAKFSDGVEIQILPAFKYHNGYKIPDPDSKGWVCTFPKRFKEKLTEINQKNSSKVVPVIKLTKELLANNNIKIKSYHVENIAVKAFENYNGKYTLKEMTLHLVNTLKSNVFKHTGDPCGQSEYIDDYLGTVKSNDRKIIANSLNSLENKLTQAKTKEDWKKLME